MIRLARLPVTLHEQARRGLWGAIPNALERLGVAFTRQPWGRPRRPCALPSVVASGFPAEQEGVDLERLTHDGVRSGRAARVEYLSGNKAVRFTGVRCEVSDDVAHRGIGVLDLRSGEFVAGRRRLWVSVGHGNACASTVRRPRISISGCIQCFYAQNRPSGERYASVARAHRLTSKRRRLRHAASAKAS